MGSEPSSSFLGGREPIPHCPPQEHIWFVNLSFQLLEFASCCFLCRIQAKNGGGGTVGGPCEGQRRGAATAGTWKTEEVRVTSQ